MSDDVIQRRKTALQQRLQEAQQNAQNAAQAHAHWQAEALGAAAALREIEELEREIAGAEGGTDEDEPTGAPALRVVKGKKGEDASEE